MQEYLIGLTNYDINVTVYDDKPWTSDVGCYEDGDLIVDKGSRNSTNTQTVIVLDYDQKPKVMVKLVMPRQPCEPLPVYLYDKTHDMEDQFKIYSKIKLYQFMDIEFNHSKHIYDKNGYANLFVYTKLKTEAELEALVMDDFNSLFYVRNRRNTANNKPPAGITYFEDSGSRTLHLRKKYLNLQNEPWAIEINLGKHDMAGQPFQLGYTLAHELLHVLIIRGARIIGTPQKDFCIGDWLADLNDEYCVGGHLNDKPNLIRDGKLNGDPPAPSSVLHPMGKIDYRAEYLMQHYLYKKVY